MSRSSLHDEMKEMAALYALGALTREEALVFDFHLLDGCEVCRSELASFEPVVAGIGLSVITIAPRAALKDELMWRITMAPTKGQAGRYPC